MLMVFTIYILYGQDSYKQNFLNQLKNLPELKTCKDSYIFFKCDDNSCKVFKASKESLKNALNDLTTARLAVNTAMTPALSPASMTPEQAEALSEKLDQMSDEEKQQWAMQNAALMMGSANMHINQDADNDVVNDAVEYVTNQQEENMSEMIKADDFPNQMRVIEEKYKSQKSNLLKNFKTASGVDYNPEIQGSYVFGIASDEEVAMFDKALIDFKNNIAVVYEAELNDKKEYMKTLTGNLMNKYSITEEKITATNYGDDALENTNKSHLYLAHQTVLGEVLDVFVKYEEILLTYANKYADLEKIERVKVNNK